MYGMYTPMKPPVRLLEGDSVLLAMGLGVDEYVELHLANYGDSLHGVAVHVGMVWPPNQILDTVVLRRMNCVPAPERGVGSAVPA